jgi:hypothetical protein
MMDHQERELHMLKKAMVLISVLWSAQLFGQLPIKTASSIRDQVNQALGGRVIGVEANYSYSEKSPTQRVGLVVDKNGVRSKTYMDYTFDENLKILHRRLYGSNNAVIWSLAAPSMLTDPSPKDPYVRCLMECAARCARLPQEQRYRCQVLCVGVCDLTNPVPTTDAR